MMADFHDAENFDAISKPDAKILILGSMPGIASLKVNQYYAHPRNAFWPIMGALLSEIWPDDFAQRYAKITAHKIALWDVIKYCRRTGSLDQNIENTSIIANDFGAFLQQHPKITTLFFNGQKAAQSFNKLVAPYLEDNIAQRIQTHILPSSSPAMASLDLASKIDKWRIIQETL